MNDEEKALCKEEEKVRDELQKAAPKYKSQKEELYGKLSKIYNEAKEDATISTEQLKKNKVKIFVLYEASEKEKEGLTDFLKDKKKEDNGIEFY